MTCGDSHAELDLALRREQIRQAASPYAIDAAFRILHSLLLATKCVPSQMAGDSNRPPAGLDVSRPAVRALRRRARRFGLLSLRTKTGPELRACRWRGRVGRGGVGKKPCEGFVPTGAAKPKPQPKTQIPTQTRTAALILPHGYSTLRRSATVVFQTARNSRLTLVLVCVCAESPHAECGTSGICFS